jgi:hypothetical protein
MDWWCASSGGVLQVVECLLCKCEALSSNASIIKEKIIPALNFLINSLSSSVLKLIKAVFAARQASVQP